MAFFLDKLHDALLSRKKDSEKDLLSITNFLETLFSCNSFVHNKRWKPYLRDFFDKWLKSNEQNCVNYDTLLINLKALRRKFSPGEENRDGLMTENHIKDKAQSISEGDCSLSSIKCTEQEQIPEDSERIICSNSTSESNFILQNSATCQTSSSDTICEINLSRDIISWIGETEVVCDSQNRKNPSMPQTLSISNLSQNLTRTAEVFDLSEDHLCQTLVVLAPSSDMASQLMEVEVGKVRPLLKAPRLCLHLYDIELRMWREGIVVDFPIPGYMLEKHSWRLAFANGNLYLFSLGKKVGLEYTLARSSWTHLQCKELFRAHNNSTDEEFPVKSIIPVSVGNELVVLSMSREPRPDGSYWTQQHIYQFDFDTKTFSHVTVVRDERMDLPITKWTVKGDDLFTLKASTVMYSSLHVYNVQHIHVYNAKTRQLKTHHVQSAMKSGLKVLVQAGKLYMLNNLGEYQQLDLATSMLSDWQRISNPAFTTVNSSVNDRSEIYPALLRTTCHAGCSRWTVSSQDNIGSASLQEMFVNDVGEFKIGHHPSPPFLHLTAMCVAKIRRGTLDQLKQARFDASTLVPS